MFIPLKMVLIGIDPYPYVKWCNSQYIYIDDIDDYNHLVISFLYDIVNIYSYDVIICWYIDIKVYCNNIDRYMMIIGRLQLYNYRLDDSIETGSLYMKSIDI
jgi:hypothetical protein